MMNMNEFYKIPIAVQTVCLLDALIDAVLNQICWGSVGGANFEKTVLVFLNPDEAVEDCWLLLEKFLHLQLLSLQCLLCLEFTLQGLHFFGES